MKPEWSADWAWGLPLTALTLAIHGAAITGMAVLLTRALTAVERRRPGRPSMALILAATLGVLGGALAILHGLEAAVWAAAYLLTGAVSTPADAMLYSVELHYRTRRIGSAAATTLENDGGTGIGQWAAAVRDQHRLLGLSHDRYPEPAR